MSLQSKLPQILRFGVFQLDVHAGELHKNGVKLKLQEQPFQVLCLLLEDPGELVSREEIRNRLWPADTFVDFDHSLNAAIKRLRDTLGDSADSPVFIETIARRGYRFIAPVNGFPASGGIEIAPTPEQSQTSLPKSGKTSEPPKRIAEGYGAISQVDGSADGNVLVCLRENWSPSIYIGTLTADGMQLLAHRRLTLDESASIPTSWTPDSTAVLFYSDRNGISEIFKQATDQPLAENLVSATDQLSEP
jgi:DNA-binding winged helix-turn-helix (wHTH) protein